jgi:sugar-specific transcriptional regulator TrmB
VPAKGRGGAREKPITPGGDAIPEPLLRGFLDLGLSPYEARVLLALLRRGSANSVDLARLSGVPRTAVYPVLQGLGTRGLAARIPGPGPAVWASPGRDQVMERLKTAEEDRVRLHRERADEVRKLLDRSLPEEPADVALPFVHVLPGAKQMKTTYEELLGEAEAEVVMFTRPPYTWTFPNPNQAVLDMLERGVDVRVLYEAEQWEDPSAEGFRTEMNLYHEAGVRARLADSLPIKLVIVDRRVALVNMLHPVAVDGYPMTLHIEHPGFSAIAAVAFDQFWAMAQPLRHTRRPRERMGSPRLRSTG